MAVVATACNDQFVFSHELGHTLGANHNHGASGGDNPSPIAPWAWGHCAPYNGTDPAKNSLRTVMSSNSSGCGPRSIRVPYYSNANITLYDWFRAGVPDLQENYRVISHSAVNAVKYRTSVDRIFADGLEP
jgi:hypothetical protein